ncbi:hypothetical protein ABKV19_020088 [Rosa sericea]
MVVSLRMSELLVHSSRWGVGLNEDIYASFPVPVPIHHDELQQLMCSCGGTRKFLVGFLEELLPFGSFLSCFKTTCIHLSATFCFLQCLITEDQDFQNMLLLTLVRDTKLVVHLHLYVIKTRRHP